MPFALERFGVADPAIGGCNRPSNISALPAWRRGIFYSMFSGTECAMPSETKRDALRESLVLALLEAVRPLQEGPDPELIMEILIEAVGVLQERLRAELTEVRMESD
jgi:hypothetical protein